jgi:hypothetical protein
MERLRGPTNIVSSLLELCFERDGSLLRNERVEKNGEMRMIFEKTNSILIYC